MLSGDLGIAAFAALGPDGAAAVASIGLRVGQLVQPMLASPAAGLDEALDAIGAASVEWKLDGARIQVHRDGDEVRLFTRNLNDDHRPAARRRRRSCGAFPGAPFVLDGEAIGLDRGRHAHARSRTR